MKKAVNNKIISCAAELVAVICSYPIFVAAAAVGVFYVTDKYSAELEAASSVGEAFYVSAYGVMLGILVLGAGFYIAQSRVERRKNEAAHQRRLKNARQKYREFLSGDFSADRI